MSSKYQDKVRHPGHVTLWQCRKRCKRQLYIAVQIPYLQTATALCCQDMLASYLAKYDHVPRRLTSPSAISADNSALIVATSALAAAYPSFMPCALSISYPYGCRLTADPNIYLYDIITQALFRRFRRFLSSPGVVRRRAGGRRRHWYISVNPHWPPTSFRLD